MEKRKQTLCNTVRTSEEVKYVAADNVFYKREDKNEQRGRNWPCESTSIYEACELLHLYSLHTDCN